MREAQPVELMQRTQRAPKAQREKNDELDEYLREPNCRVRIRLHERPLTETVSDKFFKRPPAS